MFEIPKFSIFGDGSKEIMEQIQPSILLREWSDLKKGEKETAYLYLLNLGLLDKREYSDAFVNTIAILNHEFLRICPGKLMHENSARTFDGRGYPIDRSEYAFADFKNIFMSESSPLVYRMFSLYANKLIDKWHMNMCQKYMDDGNEEECKNHLDAAFKGFDFFARVLNHVFTQFSVNAHITRNGIIPEQEERIIENIYTPTLLMLSNPKWKSVNDDISAMFSDYQEQNYQEVIAKGHRVAQRFLQILLGREEGKNGVGELEGLFKEARTSGYLSNDAIFQSMEAGLQKFLTNSRANHSTAKPSTYSPTSSDAILVMNVVLIIIQRCLQEPGKQ